MRRLLYCLGVFLGVFGFLAGVSLTLPIAASAVTVCDNPAPNEFRITEDPRFLIDPSLQEQYLCILPLGTVVQVQLYDLYNGSTPPNGGIVSDNVHVNVASGGNPNLVILTSDTTESGPNGLTPTPGATNFSEVSLSGTFIGTSPNCPPGVVEGDSGNGCDGFRVQIGVVAGSPQFLTIVSDTPVPEPSTGLLLGIALPALLAVRRRFS